MSEFEAGEQKSSGGKLILAWLVVLAPAIWGVYNTALRAAKLFQ